MYRVLAVDREQTKLNKLLKINQIILKAIFSIGQ